MMASTEDKTVSTPGDIQTASSTPVTRIRPSRGWVSLRLRDLWDYRELLYFLCWRTIKVRYRHTILGASWAIVQPLFAMLLFSLVFGRWVRVPSDGVPYPLFVYCGLLPWQLFSQCLVESATSLVNNEHLLTKVFFPRLAIPLSTVLISLLDFACAGLVLVGLLLYYGIPVTPRVLSLPFIMALGLAVALGVGLWLSALNVRYRDVRYLIPLLTQLWFFATPIAYPSSLVPDRWHIFLWLNPLAGVVDGFRWALLGTNQGIWMVVVVSALMAVMLLASGAAYFRRTERTLADLL